MNGFEDQLDTKMFKVVKQTDDESKNENKSKSSLSSHSHDTTEVYSMNQLINRGADFLKNQIFTTDLNKNVEGQEQFTYVQILISDIETDKTANDDSEEEDKILVQVIDYSDRILYNSMKEEQNFSQIVSAAVSHELRNPLHSLIGQIATMETFFTAFAQLIEIIKKQKGALNDEYLT